MKGARELAVNILIQIESEGIYPKELVAPLDKHLEPREASFVRELVYGCIENLSYIDSIIVELSDIKFKKIHLPILQILRTAIYQLIYLDNIPESAVVNEAVELTKKFSHKATVAFVNALLRNVARKKNDYKDVNIDMSIAELSRRLSIPAHILNIWAEELDGVELKKLLIASNEKPRLCIRVNTLLTNRDELIELLKAKNIETSIGLYSENAIYVNNPILITQTDEFRKGLFTIQDESSIIAIEALDPISNSRVLDMCAAPAGKATYIAQLMNNKGEVIARDINESKVQKINSIAKRLKVNIIKAQSWDALILDNELMEEFDFVLLDAPCSGLGVIKRRPDIKWRRSEKDIKSLLQLQTTFLRNASKYVRKDGKLMYSTCTINKSENIYMVRDFLSNNPNFELIPFHIDNISEESTKEGYLQLYPHKHNTDGFFFALMIRKW